MKERKASDRAKERKTREARSDAVYAERKAINAAAAVNCTEAAIIDGATGKALAKRIAAKPGRLETLRDHHAELRRVYRLVDKGELDEEVARSRAYVLNIMADLVERGDIEQRLTVLEHERARANGEPVRALPAPNDSARAREGGNGADDDA